jgi:hypothetical protein
MKGKPISGLLLFAGHDVGPRPIANDAASREKENCRSSQEPAGVAERTHQSNPNTVRRQGNGRLPLNQSIF